MDVCLHLPFWTSLHHVYKTLCFLLHFEFKREPGSNKQAIKVLLFWCNYPCRETQAHKYIFFFLSAHKNQPKLFLFIELKILQYYSVFCISFSCCTVLGAQAIGGRGLHEVSAHSHSASLWLSLKPRAVKRRSIQLCPSACNDLQALLQGHT